MNVTAIILCGGKERRFGSSKADAIVGGKRIIDRLTERLKFISNQILVVTSPEKKDTPLTGQAQIVIDKYPGKGPLGGVYTGLLAAENQYSIVVGCDNPFINNRLLQYMVSLTNSYDAVIPRLGKDMIEALHSIYSRSCIPVMQQALEENRLSIYKIIDRLNVRYVHREEYLPLDPRMLSFFNINFAEDLERANRIALTEDTTGFLPGGDNAPPPPAPSAP
jgi:molybdopterin-guanine dinucleotide biosynthesis protein A